MNQTSLYSSDDSCQCGRVRYTLATVRAVIAHLHESNRRLRNIAYFEAFALALAFIGLASVADWRVTATFYAVAICYLPFFAKR